MPDAATVPPSWRTDPRLFLDSEVGRPGGIFVALREGKVARTIDLDPHQGVFIGVGADGRPVTLCLIAPVAEPTASKFLMELLVLCAEGQPGATGPRPSVAQLEAIARVFREANDRLTADRLADGWRPTTPATAAG